MTISFDFPSIPKIVFGTGKLNILPGLIAPYGNSVALVTGKQSFSQSDNWNKLQQQLTDNKITWNHVVIDREPTPAMIDECVSTLMGTDISAVVAIGGGSVLDAGKAISGMFCEQGSVREYLEGVGHKSPSGNKKPYISIPTTAGTGAEATKNAVISEVGKNGFKKSIRHDNYVPDIALVDPGLMLNCPESITAQSGMDAFTQLLESYLSTNANPMTDALAVDGIRNIRDGLEGAVHNGKNISFREKMAYASMLSGITLANAGLGTVHGFASSIGGFFDIPHGLVCARMMGPVNDLTVEKLHAMDSNGIGLKKYARIGKLFSVDKNRSDGYYIDLLLEIITHWTETFPLKRLAEYGLRSMDFQRIIATTGNKYNPIPLEKHELEEALRRAL